MILDNFGNRLYGEFTLSSFTMMDIDNLIRKNFRRLIEQRNIQQNTLAESIGVRPSVINDILAGRKPMGKDTMMRLCKTLNIDPWEFYWTDKTPIVKDAYEQQRVYRYREEERLGIAEEITRYEDYQINAAKKNSGAGGQSASKRVPGRSSKKAG